MKRLMAAAFLTLGPTIGIASAATVDASLIPDGTYTVKVLNVADAKHIRVTMDNGAEVLFPSNRSEINFLKVKPGDSLKIGVVQGNIAVFMDLTSH